MAPSSNVSDAALVESARGGSCEAFAELWSRHMRAGLGFARAYSSSMNPEDLVSEAFTRIFSAIRNGKGPTGAFRAYLIATIRNIAIAWGRSGRLENTFDEFDLLEGAESAESEAMTALENSITSKAFSSLPARWQEVLWYSEVEQLPRADIAVILGITPNAVSQLTFRAREALRAAWIQAHLNSSCLGPEHRNVVSLLGARARGRLSRRDARVVEEHVAGCMGCLIIAEEADEVGSRLALVIVPLIAGLVGASSYLAAIQAGAGTVLAAEGVPSAGGALPHLPPLGGGSSLSSGVMGGSSAATVASSMTAWVVGVSIAASVSIVTTGVWDAVGATSRGGPTPPTAVAGVAAPALPRTSPQKPVEPSRPAPTPAPVTPDAPDPGAVHVGDGPEDAPEIVIVRMPSIVEPAPSPPHLPVPDPVPVATVARPPELVVLQDMGDKWYLPTLVGSGEPGALVTARVGEVVSTTAVGHRPIGEPVAAAATGLVPVTQQDATGNASDPTSAEFTVVAPVPGPHHEAGPRTLEPADPAPYP